MGTARSRFGSYDSMVFPKCVVVFGLLCELGFPVAADVAVQIVDYPTSVLRYSPVFITGRIENYGSTPVLVPASNGTSNRWFVEVGPTPESLSERRFAQASTTSTLLVWLKPGESQLFLDDIGHWLGSNGPGRYLVRAGLNGTGECLYYAKGDEDFPLKALVKKPGYEIYECWSGHELSDTVFVDVLEPELAVDREALQYLESPDAPFCCGKSKFHVTLQFGAPYLLERFPTSHYTYIGIFHACRTSPECLQKILDLQPSNPLTPYTRFQQALASVRSGRGEEVPLQALDIPTALKDYLVQEIAAEEKRQSRATSRETVRPAGPTGERR